MHPASGISKAAALLCAIGALLRAESPATSNALAVAAALEAEAAQAPLKRPVVAGELVKLYAAAGEADRALAWAQVVMERNPEPQAYLAGVYSLLGRDEDAVRILEAELKSPPAAERAVPLYWQLADSLERLGKADAAQRALESACGAAGESVFGREARARLDKFLERRMPSNGDLEAGDER